MTLGDLKKYAKDKGILDEVALVYYDDIYYGWREITPDQVRLILEGIYTDKYGNIIIDKEMLTIS